MSLDFNLTWKPLDQVGDEPQSHSSKRSHKAKARLVVLGYLDPKIEEIPRDSPTLNKTSRMIALQVISSHSWKLRSFDIKAAFLQGQPQADRVIAIDPVPELRKSLDLKPQEICRLNKSAHGLIDAPYLWYCSLVSKLTQLGFEASPFDPCCFCTPIRIRRWPTGPAGRDSGNSCGRRHRWGKCDIRRKDPTTREKISFWIPQNFSFHFHRY